MGESFPGIIDQQGGFAGFGSGQEPTEQLRLLSNLLPQERQFLIVADTEPSRLQLARQPVFFGEQGRDLNFAVSFVVQQIEHGQPQRNTVLAYIAIVVRAITTLPQDFYRFLIASNLFDNSVQ